MSSREQRTLQLTAHAAATLRARGIDSALIGALAVAVHGHQDADLATNVDPFTQLRDVAADLRREGFQVELVLPDADDPLGGVVDDVQAVNFWNPLRMGGANPGEAAIRSATDRTLGGTTLRVVDLAHLIALKLYAGGPKSHLDIIELLTRNPEANLEERRTVCAGFGLQAELDAIVDGLGR